MADATIAGNIFTIDNPQADGCDSIPYEHKLALLIEFESIEEIRKAMATGKAEFTVLGEKV